MEIHPQNDRPFCGHRIWRRPADKRFAEAIVPQDSLYNLRQDPSETHNAISENPDIAKRLKERLTQLENLK
ncbi:MAG: hypothetical protein ACLUKN_17100 [Bacilli bacterium]